MIKALLLIFAPAYTWERIARARRNLFFVLFLFLIPTVAISVAAEVHVRNYYELHSTALNARPLTIEQEIRLGAVEAGAWLVVVFVGAFALKMLSETFHNRNTYAQCFTAIAYASAPFYLFHLLDLIPGTNLWISVAVGMFFTFSALYYAVPIYLKPDPPHAFGLFLTGGIMLTLLNVIARLFMLAVIEGRIKLY